MVRRHFALVLILETLLDGPIFTFKAASSRSVVQSGVDLPERLKLPPREHVLKSAPEKPTVRRAIFPNPLHH